VIDEASSQQAIRARVCELRLGATLTSAQARNEWNLCDQLSNEVELAEWYHASTLRSEAEELVHYKRDPQRDPHTTEFCQRILPQLARLLALELAWPRS
jgi:hypothetical protein